jgi:hypothetical protein
LSRVAEVQFGEAHERPILQRWLKASKTLPTEVRWTIASAQYHDFDFILLDAEGVLNGYLEVKVRRVPFADYRDAIFPYRKHELAVRIRDRFDLPMLAVVEYACGALYEIDLSTRPAKVADIKRTDRPRPVSHAIYTEEQMTPL